MNDNVKIIMHAIAIFIVAALVTTALAYVHSRMNLNEADRNEAAANNTAAFMVVTSLLSNAK